MNDNIKTISTDQQQALTHEQLGHFCGSETWYRHPLFKKYLYTEGVQYVAEKGEAYWLIDKIFACQSCVQTLQNQEFCVWTLKRNEQGQGARLTCTDGNETELYAENITFTDFPLTQIRFYFTNNVLLLTSEY